MTERRRATGGFLWSYEGRLSLLLAAGWLVLVLGRNAIPPLLPAIVMDLRLEPVEAGFVMTVVMGFHSVLQYPAGRVSDQLSRLTVLAVSLLTTMVGFGLLIGARTYPALLVGGATVGIGTGLFFTPARALLSDHFADRLGQVLGIQTTAGLVGASLSGALATAVVAYAAWRHTFVLPLVATAFVVLALHQYSQERYRLTRPSLDVFATARRLLGDVAVRRLLGVATIRSLVNASLIAFLPLVLIEAKGFAPVLANGAYASLFVVGAVASPLFGRMGDRYSQTLVMTAALAVAVAGVMIVTIGTTAPIVVSGVGLASLGLWGFTPVMQAVFLEAVATESMGGDFGALKTVYGGIGSTGPSLFGVLVSQGSYRIAFLALAGCLLVCIGILHLGSRST